MLCLCWNVLPKLTYLCGQHNQLYKYNGIWWRKQCCVHIDWLYSQFLFKILSMARDFNYNGMIIILYTPGTRGWSRLRDRTLAVAKNRAKMTFFSGGEKIPKKNIFLGKFYFFTEKKLIFSAVFLLFTASVRSRPPGPPAVPGVLLTIPMILV